MDTMMTGSELKAIRERLGLTGPAFAALINGRVSGARVTKQAVWGWENGVRTPSPAMQTVIRLLASQEQ